MARIHPDFITLCDEIAAQLNNAIKDNAKHQITRADVTLILAKCLQNTANGHITIIINFQRHSRQHELSEPLEPIRGGF